MDFGVLGPLVVTARGERIDVPGAKERTLLAHLLAYAGRMVPVGDLAESLWGERPPRSPTKALQNHVLRLRNALEPDRGGGPRLLVTDGGGYRLAVDPVQLDAERFARLVTVGRQALARDRPEAAVSALEEALVLWRGPAYASFEETHFGRAEARRLEELRLSATEDLWSGHLLAGSADAVPDLERLVAEHPLRERRWSLLVRALYRQGRQGAALEAWTRARDVLAVELGVDPGPELRELQRQVLAQDPALDAPTRPLPAGLDVSTPLVGREVELSRLRHAWDRARAGETPTVVLRGPRGSGRSRLAAELAAEVAPSASGLERDGDRIVLRSDPGSLTLLSGTPGATPPAGSEVVELGPLAPADVRRLVATYVPAAEVDDRTAEVLMASGGWPGRAHEECLALARTAATERVGLAVRAADASRASLASARREVADGVAVLRETSSTPDAAADACPWRGLVRYETADAPWYCGRERAVAELVARVAGSRVVALVGPSGSGKSSLVRAGLLAALADDVIPGSASWTRLVMRPGEHPLRELARQALGERSVDVGDLLSSLVLRAEGESPDSPQTVLVVDQLEEVWTACTDEAERASFLSVLGELAADERSSVRVVLAVRGDYLARLADEPGLAGPLADNALLVGTLSPAEVRRVVEQPARRAGLLLTEGLPDALVTDAGSEPGLLPLVSSCLTRLWERREGRLLTLGAYVAMGGLHGAIAQVAEDAVAALSDDARNTARILLLRLAGPGDGDGVTRRRVSRAELLALDLPHLTEVETALADARLLTVSAGHVEVAHEALFREWPRLREWLVEDATGRAVQRRLAMAAGEWDAEGRDPAALWRGARLLAATEVARVRPEELTAVEHGFLTSSRAAVEAEQRADALRAEASQRQNRRLRWLLGLAAALVVLAVVATYVVVRSRGEAEEARTVADAQRLAATALNVDYPDLALLTAIEAVRIRADPQTYGALLTLLARQPDVLTRVRIPTRFLTADASADGGVMVLADNTDRVTAIDADTADVLWERDFDGRLVATVSVDPAGSRAFVTLSDDDSAAAAMLDLQDGSTIWRVTDAQLAEELPGGADPYPADGAWYRSGSVALTTLTHAVVLGADDGRLLHAREWSSPYPYDSSFRVWPDGRTSIAVDELGNVGVAADPRRPSQPELRLPGTAYAVSSDGTIALLTRGAQGLRLELRKPDLHRSSPRWPLGQDEVWEVRWTPDGSRLLVGDGERLDIRDGRTAAPLEELVGHSGEVMAARVAGSDHDLVWTAGRDGTAVAFDLTGRRGIVSTRPVEAHSLAGSVSADGDLALYNTKAGLEPPQPRLMDPRSGHDLGALSMDGLTAVECGCSVATTAITPDGTLALAGLQYRDTDGSPAAQGSLAVWDSATRQRVGQVDLPWGVLGLSVTPDGGTAVLNGRTGYALVDLSDLSAPTVRGDLHDQPEMDWLFVSHNTALSPDGTHAALGRGAHALVVDLTTGDVVATHDVDPMTHIVSLAWSRDGETLVAGLHDGHLAFLDALGEGSVAPTRLVTGGFVMDLATSDSGAYLASLGGDGDVMLWDTATWRPYGQPLTDDAGLGWTYFPPGEHVVRTYYESGLVTDIDVRPSAWVAAACRAARRDLTADESAQLRPGELTRPTCPA